MLTSQCFLCKHYCGDMKCKAFPTGIHPNVINTLLDFDGTIKWRIPGTDRLLNLTVHFHDHKLTGDKGKRFELDDDKVEFYKLP